MWGVSLTFIDHRSGQNLSYGRIQRRISGKRVKVSRPTRVYLSEDQIDQLWEIKSEKKFKLLVERCHDIHVMVSGYLPQSENMPG